MVEICNWHKLINFKFQRVFPKDICFCFVSSNSRKWGLGIREIMCSIITFPFLLVSVSSMKAKCEKFLKEFDKLEFNDDIDDGKFA